MAPEAGDQMSTKAITVRLDLDSKSDSIIWEKLQRIHKVNKLPYGKAVIYALRAYEPDDMQNENQRIITRKFANDVLDELKTVLPSFISGYIAGNMSALPANVPVMTKEETHTVMRSQSDDTACDTQPKTDFQSSHIDFGFAGS